MLTDDPETTAEAKAQREADVRELYEAARELVAMHDAFNAGHPLQVDFSAFEPWLRKWLTATDAKTMGWVQSAISVDKVRRHRRSPSARFV